MMAGVVLISMDEVDAEGNVASLSCPGENPVYYTSLTEAVEEYNSRTNAGDYHLTLLAEISEDVIINQPGSTIAKKLTIHGNGQVVNSTITLEPLTKSETDGSHNPYKGMVCFENIVFKYTDNSPIYSSAKNKQVHNIHVNGCHFDMEGGTYAISLRNAINVTIQDSTCKGGWGIFYARQVSYGLSMDNVTTTDCTYGLSGYRLHGEVNLDGCTMDTKFGVYLYDTKSKTTVSNCRITAEYPFYYYYKDSNNYNAELYVKDNEFISKTGNPWLTVDDKQGLEVYVEGRSISLPEISTTNVTVHDHRASCGVDRTCEVCQQTIQGGDHEYETDTSILCKVHTCIHCSATTTAVPCKYDSSKALCEVSNCEYCGEPRDLEDHTPNGPACKATACSLCGTSITPVSHDLPYTCKDAECGICHETITHTGSHDLPSNATCIDRTCSDCGTVVRGDGEHDYEISGYQKVCSMCGDTVNLPIEEDDDDDWYWLWLQKQAAAKAEAERIAQEQAEEEEKKKVAAVAVAVGAAVAMVLLLMTTPRN